MDPLKLVSLLLSHLDLAEQEEGGFRHGVSFYLEKHPLPPLSLLIVWQGPVVLLELIVKANGEQRGVDVALVNQYFLHFDLIVFIVPLVDNI